MIGNPEVCRGPEKTPAGVLAGCELLTEEAKRERLQLDLSETRCDRQTARTWVRTNTLSMGLFVYKVLGGRAAWSVSVGVSVVYKFIGGIKFA